MTNERILEKINQLIYLSIYISMYLSIIYLPNLSYLYIHRVNFHHVIRVCSICTGFLLTFHSSISNSACFFLLSLFLLSPLGHFHQLYFEAVLTVLNREESAATLAAGGVHGPLAEASSPTRVHRSMSSRQFSDSTKRRCCHALGRHRNWMNFKIRSISGVL